MSRFSKHVYKQIGLKIRAYRQKFGYTQEELSELLGVNYKYIGHVERCERQISLKVLTKIMELFKIQPVEFFSFEDTYNF